MGVKLFEVSATETKGFFRSLSNSNLSYTSIVQEGEWYDENSSEEETSFDEIATKVKSINLIPSSIGLKSAMSNAGITTMSRLLKNNGKSKAKRNS